VVEPGEVRSRGVRQVLSPVVNIADDVRWGRVEETYGEDPYLSSVMGTTFVRAFEAAGIVTTPKHFVANVGEGGRDSWVVEPGEFRIMVGASSVDIRLRGHVTVRRPS
jgi:beta-glucosidase